MDIVKTIDMKVYRKLYANYLVLICIMIGVSYFLLEKGFYVRWDPLKSALIKNFLLYGMVGVAIAYSLYQKNQGQKLQAIEDFEEKKIFHEKYFKIRMLWYAGSCFVSCILFMLVFNWFFFYFALFELFLLLIVFPNKFFVKKELNDDDIVFI